MSKEIKNKIVPIRRFPEFKDEGEWEGKEFNQLFEIGNGRDYKHLSKGNIPVYGSGGYMLSVDDYLYDGESVCIGRKGTIDKPMLLNGKFWTVDTLFYTHSFKDCCPKFIYSIFQTINWQSYNEAGGVPSLSKTTINKIKTYIPKPSEQQKIADCLSSLDELLTAENQKMHALKQYKKGLMQQLFPAEGETVPKLRFKEFKDNWLESKLESLIDLLSGYAFQSEYFSNNGMKLLIPKNFTKDGKANFNHENTKYTTENFDPKYICKEGDLMLLITDLTPSCELLGKPILLTKEDGEVLLNQRIIRVIPKSSIERRFLLYFFSTEIYHKRIKDTATGSTVRHSSNSIIAETQIYVPSTTEQIKIANLLSSLDETISKQTEKIETLKIHKKGLMQSLFPNTTN